ncbi:glycoside hydrolase family 3 C-terminal domain-containing protein [Dyella aluminiiresistens]|uniref:glycoside hydrolase family 3 C-terminal domain-containing protein n=1 Tax=Dyella aluminiiresistens TaxID=3069105 RepID=UPI00399D023E
MNVTQLPAPVALAATWDTNLAEQYGAVVGDEQWGKGVDVDLGPTVNIVRDPRWGRAFESYGEDPYLNGYIGAGYVNGVQSTGVMAEVKHWALYNQETDRNTSLDDVSVSERTMQELYLPAFQIIVDHAHPASFMCSYASINGDYACQNSFLLTKVLRDQFKYPGFVVSDWDGTHSTVASAKAGLNVEMPAGLYYGKALEQAVKSGKVSTDTIDQLVRPILVEMFRMHLFSHQPTGNIYSKVTTPAHVDVAREVAEQSAVLLKNAGNVLPLSAEKIHSIAVIGTDAGPDALTSGGGSARINADAIVTPREGIESRAGSSVTVRYAQGDVPDGPPPLVPARYLTPASGKGHGLTEQLYANTDFSGTPVATRVLPELNVQLWGKTPSAKLKQGQWSAKYSGTINPPVSGIYTFTLTSAGDAKLFVDGRQIITRPMFSTDTLSATIELTAGRPVSLDVKYHAPLGMSIADILGSSLRLGWKVPVPGNVWPRKRALLEQAVHMAAKSDVAIVFASKFETEGMDLQNADLGSDLDHLISAVAAVNPHTIVVLNTGSAVTMPWLNKVAGVVEAWYPGQEDGKAIAALLFGDVNPSGKLPVTFPRSLADVPASTQAQWPGVDGKVEYSEGLQVGYRWYDAKHVKPLFAFGSGLSYTSFKFSHLHVTPEEITPQGSVEVTVEITNTGHRAGADVAQLYVGDPASTGEPEKQLRGFSKVVLEPGQTRTVSFSVPAHAFAAWSKSADGWQVADGSYRILVGDSSEHLPEQSAVRVSAAAKGLVAKAAR